MKRFNNIIIVVDRRRTDEESTLSRAVALAKHNEANLTVVEVFKKMPHDMEIALPSKHLGDIQEAVTKERHEWLEHFIKPIETKGVSIATKILIGTPFLEIIREVLKNDHDLVILTAEGTGELREMLFGSTTMQLMRKCPCPVWVITSTQTEKSTRILAAVDPVPRDVKRNTLNVKIIETASFLARLEKSELHVVHAWQAHDEYLYSRRLATDLVDMVLKDLLNMHQDWLSELIKQCTADIPQNRLHILKGEAWKVIPALSKKLQVELIVMGTVARTGISGMYMGNTAEKVLHNVDCSVVAVKPDGFVTPVTL